MPVDFTPVEITVYRPPEVVEKFLTKLPAEHFKKITSTCILFLIEETAKRFMRRFGHADLLFRKPKRFDDFSVYLKSGKLEKPIIKPSDLTVARRKVFPEYIYASIDGKRGFRVLATSDGYIYCSGRKIKLSGRKWKQSGFYSVFE